MENIISTKFIIQIIIFIVLILFFLYMADFSIALMHEKRIGKYALNNRSIKFSFFDQGLKTFNNIKNKLSHFLSKIFKKYNKNNEKYATKNNIFINQGIDILSVNFMFFIINTILSFIFNLFNQTNMNIFNILLFPIICLIIINIFIAIKYKNRIKHIKNDFLEAIEIINIALKSNESLLKGIKNVTLKLDGDIKNEFDIILNNINYGLSFHEAFNRFYKRNNINEIKYFITILSNYEVIGNNITTLFDQVERNITNNISFKNNINSKLKLYKFGIFMISLIPLFYVVIKYLIFHKSFEFSIYSLIVITGIVLLYLIYLLLSLLIVKVNYYDTK